MDVERGIEMFDSVNVPCVSVVENMAYLQIDNDDDNNNDENQPFSLNEEELKNAFMHTLKENGITEMDEDDKKKTKSIVDSLVKIVQKSVKDVNVKSNQSSKQIKIFGQGHKKRLSEQWGIEHTYSVPLLDKIAYNGDHGTPFILEYPDSPQASIYNELAANVVREVVKIQYSQEQNRPTAKYNEGKNIIEFERMSVDIGSNDDKSTKTISTFISSATLRRECKCAACVEELTGRQILKPTDIPESVKPININPTGNYALSVDWSDGHRSLYPFKQIRSLLESDVKEIISA